MIEAILKIIARRVNLPHLFDGLDEDDIIRQSVVKANTIYVKLLSTNCQLRDAEACRNKSLRTDSYDQSSILFTDFLPDILEEPQLIISAFTTWLEQWQCRQLRFAAMLVMVDIGDSLVNARSIGDTLPISPEFDLVLSALLDLAIKHLKDPEENIRVLAIWVLPHWPDEQRRHNKKILLDNMLHDENFKVREAAVAAGATDVEQLMTIALKDPYSDTSVSAIRFIKRQKVPLDISGLIICLNSPYTETRSVCAALAQILWKQDVTIDFIVAHVSGFTKGVAAALLGSKPAIWQILRENLEEYMAAHPVPPAESPTGEVLPQNEEDILYSQRRVFFYRLAEVQTADKVISFLLDNVRARSYCEQQSYANLLLLVDTEDALTSLLDGECESIAEMIIQMAADTGAIWIDTFMRNLLDIWSRSDVWWSRRQSFIEKLKHEPHNFLKRALAGYVDGYSDFRDICGMARTIESSDDLKSLMNRLYSEADWAIFEYVVKYIGRSVIFRSGHFEIDPLMFRLILKRHKLKMTFETALRILALERRGVFEWDPLTRIPSGYRPTLDSAQAELEWSDDSMEVDSRSVSRGRPEDSQGQPVEIPSRISSASTATPPAAQIPLGPAESTPIRPPALADAFPSPVTPGRFNFQGESISVPSRISSLPSATQTGVQAPIEPPRPPVARALMDQAESTPIRPLLSNALPDPVTPGRFNFHGESISIPSRISGSPLATPLVVQAPGETRGPPVPRALMGQAESTPIRPLIADVPQPPATPGRFNFQGESVSIPSRISSLPSATQFGAQVPSETLGPPVARPSLGPAESTPVQGHLSLSEMPVIPECFNIQGRSISLPSRISSAPSAVPSAAQVRDDPPEPLVAQAAVGPAESTPLQVRSSLAAAAPLYPATPGRFNYQGQSMSLPSRVSSAPSTTLLAVQTDQRGSPTPALQAEPLESTPINANVDSNPVSRLHSNTSPSRNPSLAFTESIVFEDSEAVTESQAVPSGDLSDMDYSPDSPEAESSDEILQNRAEEASGELRPENQGPSARYKSTPNESVASSTSSFVLPHSREEMYDMLRRLDEQDPLDFYRKFDIPEDFTFEPLH